MIERVLAVADDAACQYLNETQKAAAGCGTTGTVVDPVNNIINVAIGLVGVAAVIVIIIGGITYTTSQGDPGKTKRAKDTILYGVIGLVIAILAFAIVNFIIAGIA